MNIYSLHFHLNGVVGIVLEPSGKLGSNFASMDKALSEVEQRKPSFVYIDLEKIRTLDSTDAVAIMRLYSAITNLGGREIVAVSGNNPRVQEFVTSLNLNSIIPVFSDRPEAVEFLSKKLAESQKST